MLTIGDLRRCAREHDASDGGEGVSGTRRGFGVDASTRSYSRVDKVKGNKRLLFTPLDEEKPGRGSDEAKLSAPTSIGSASFTDRCQPRNIEVGVLVDDASFGRQVALQWQGLVNQKLVQRAVP